MRVTRWCASLTASYLRGGPVRLLELVSQRVQLVGALGQAFRFVRKGRAHKGSKHHATRTDA